MFKKTINELKSIEPKHEVTFKVDDESTRKTAKTIIKTVFAIAVINVVAHGAIAAIDASLKTSEKSED